MQGVLESAVPSSWESRVVTFSGMLCASHGYLKLTIDLVSGIYTKAIAQ